MLDSPTSQPDPIRLPSSGQSRISPSPVNEVIDPARLVPAAAIAVALTILAGARREQIVAGALALVVGAVLYMMTVRTDRRGASSGEQL